MNWKHVDVVAFGGPENLRVVEEMALPEPQRGQVRVKVLTAGTGFTDTIIRKGQYPYVKTKPPFTLGYDYFGMIDKVGVDVTTLKVGDYVADMPRIGGYTQYLCADADRLVPCPAGLDPAEAVCMILSYTAAYQMLTRECSLKKGDAILVHAAGGAVGTALLELGRLMGLKVYGTESKGKHAVVSALGAMPIDYRSEDFVARTLRLSPGGVQAVFDPIGGRNWARSYRCLARGGKLVSFGAQQVVTGEEKKTSVLLGYFKLHVLWKLSPDGKQTGFYDIQKRRDKHPDEFRLDVQALMNLLAQSKLHPVVAKIEPLERAADVHRQIDNAEIAGRVVLRCNP